MRGGVVFGHGFERCLFGTIPSRALPVLSSRPAEGTVYRVFAKQFLTSEF